MNRTEWMLKIVLRLAGVGMLLAIGGVFLPLSWMAACHERLGLGAFPDAPIVEYLARCTSGLYAILGGVFLLSSWDVRRYGPVITLTAAGMIPAALAVWAYATLAGERIGRLLLGDVLTAIPFAAVVLFLQFRLRKERQEDSANNS